MEDKKIIDGYELARAILDTGMKRQDSTLMMIAGIVSKFVDDASDELLKEQEAQLVLNIAEQIGCKSGSCPKCGKMLNTTCNKRYCGDCGQAVKWN